MSDEAKYLIKKGAYFYRQKYQGYTNFKFDAGRYTKEQAEAEASVEPWHMSAVHEDDVPDTQDPDKFIAGLRAEIAELKRQIVTAQKVDEQQTADFIKDRAEIARLRAAIAGIADDYMTSENHHPGYVLIPTAKFEALRAMELSTDA
jgi:hypothetical protein